MQQVKIAEFKAHLSSHLRKVRNGEEIVILDRQEPIAKISPFKRKKSELTIIPAKEKGNWKKLTLKGPKLDIDVVKLIRQDRNREYDRLR